MYLNTYLNTYLNPYYIHNNAIHLSQTEINRIYLMTHQLYSNHNYNNDLYTQTLLTNTASNTYNRSFFKNL
jgi:hypothetical protein